MIDPLYDTFMASLAVFLILVLPAFLIVRELLQELIRFLCKGR